MALALSACAYTAQPTVPSQPHTGANDAPAELVVFAAASLDGAFRAIGSAFEAAHPGTTVTFNFAGSQTLATQILEGAGADVFASANAAQLDALVRGGEVLGPSVRTFARNRLVVVYPADNPAGLTTLQDLAGPGLKLILAQKGVPVGDYAQELLAKASAHPDFDAAFGPRVLANVVSYEDDVRGVLTKVALGEADAGIVYASDFGPGDAGRAGRLEIPGELNVDASYPMAPLAATEHPELARAFVDHVLSPAGQAVLVEHGFLAAGGG